MQLAPNDHKNRHLFGSLSGGIIYFRSHIFNKQVTSLVILRLWSGNEGLRPPSILWVYHLIHDFTWPISRRRRLTRNDWGNREPLPWWSIRCRHHQLYRTIRNLPLFPPSWLSTLFKEVIMFFFSFILSSFSYGYDIKQHENLYWYKNMSKHKCSR